MVDNKQQWKAWLYLSPAILLLLVFTVWPIFNTVRIAFLEGYSRIDLHTSGHADGSTIRTVIDTIDPGCIIPMHTERPDGFLALSDGRKILFAQDGVPVTL